MKKRLLLLLLSITLAVMSLAIPCNASEQERFVLSQEEQAYLQSLSGRVLKLGVTSEVTSFIDIDGAPAGLLLPMIELMQSWGVTIDTVHPSWKDGFTQLHDGTIDLLGLCGLSTTRREQYYCSEMLYRSHMEVFTRRDSPLTSLVNLSDKVIGLTSNSTLVPKLREYLYPDGRIEYFDSIDDMFEALEQGEIDALISAMNLQSELLNHPKAAFEMRIESAAAQQGIYAFKAELAPLIAVLNRYLASGEGETLRQAISARRTEDIYKIARKYYKDDIDDVLNRYDELRLYNSGALYPLCFEQNGEIKGIQVEINNIFTAITGKPITMHVLDEFKNGVTSVLDEIRAGTLVGACSIYYTSEFATDPDFAFSRAVLTDTASLFGPTELSALSDFQGIRVGTTPMFGDSYLEWETLTGRMPDVYPAPKQVLQALQDGEIDAAFVSNMCVDYYYTVRNDFSLRRLGTLSMQCNLHLLYGAGNESFNRLMDLSIMLRNIVDPQSDSRWFNETRNDQFELVRVQHELNRYHRFIIIISMTMSALLILALALVWYHLHKFRAYDRQVTTLLSTQQNVDFLWGNLRTNEFKSQGNYPLFRAWGIDSNDKEERDQLLDEVRVMSEQFAERQHQDKALKYIVREREVLAAADGMVRYTRNYYHALGKDEYMVFVQDITEEKRREENLQHIADTDPLSQLLTRRAMDARMNEVLLNAEPGKPFLFMYMIDIDNFKKVNDTYGHSIGDLALTSVAKVLKDCLPDSIVSRWGGEEFLVCASAPDRASAEAMGRLIVSTVENTAIPVYSRTSLRITISCGLSELVPGEPYVAAVLRADDAQYDAKRSGKNRLCVRYLEMKNSEVTCTLES